MAVNKQGSPNIDNSDLVNFPNGRIRDNSGAGDGTPVNRFIYSDIHEFFAKVMRLAAIEYSDLPDSEGNGYQLVDAIIALAGKNDFITPLNTSGGTIQIPLKLSTLKLNESLICLSAFDYTTETTIKGTETAVKNISVPSLFKTGDYIRMVNTSSEIKLIRLADGANLNSLVAELNFLKGATDAEEFDGTSLVKATTPYTNQLAFTRRVIGMDSHLFLASTTRNGLMSSADKILLANLVNPIKNVGWFSGVSPGGGSVGASMPRSGDIISSIQEIVSYSPDNSANTYFVTLANPMANLNYFVRTSIESEGTLQTDNDIAGCVFKVVSTTQFRWSLTEKKDGSKSLKIHLEVVQIS